MRKALWPQLFAPFLIGFALAGVGLALLMIPWLPGPDGRPIALHAPPALAAPLVHGRVLWKNTEDAVADVGINVADQASGQVVMSTRTDATGWYTLTVGVGTWLLDIPSTTEYWGYAQPVTVLPHDEYVLDFAITPRPPGASVPPSTPTPRPVAIAGVSPTPVLPGAPGTLPTNGQPADPAGLGLLALAGGVALGAGLALRRGNKMKIAA